MFHRTGVLPSLIALGFGLSSPSLTAAPAAPTAEQTVFFEQKVRPVLVEHCYDCHSAQAKKIKGGLLLDSRSGWELGGDSGQPALVRGEPEKSLLIQSIRHDDTDKAMPPKKPKLPATAIADLIAWVRMGAPDPREGATTEVKRADKSWWSLQPLRKTEADQSIDGFVKAKLAEKGLTMSSPALPRDFIRRITYDLTGLPPTMTEIEAFEQAYQTDADSSVQSLVDRLLASPRYGEQWGRHWLDVVRFGESKGFERNVIIDNLWPFRDYVIKSHNDDKPMSQLITEHLAGDIIGKDDPKVEVGTAFLVAGPYDDVGNQDKVAQAQIRANTLDDVISATGSAFLGLTINCARCHNHKFDPVPTEDYYRLRAAFEGVNHSDRILATAEERKQFQAAMKPLDESKAKQTAKKQALEETISKRLKKNSAEKLQPAPQPSLTEEIFAPVEARYVKFKILGTSQNPASGVGARLDEFEIWSGDRNVALASEGAKAEGASSRQAEDFAEAYDVRQVNDGKFGARWFVGSPAELLITLPKLESIQRVSFSNIRNTQNAGGALGPYVAEYELWISKDGTQWTKAADSLTREPVNVALAHERKMRAASPDERAKLATLTGALAAIETQIKAVPPLKTVWAGKLQPVKEKTFVHVGGDPQKHGADIVPASLNVLDRVTRPYVLPVDAPEGERRLALAKWITGNDNPLTARVLANRVWHYHFGTGIVDTPSDFGFLGGRPTHPELLDWLAQRLIANGWKLKGLHREILLSQTYRQSASYREEGAKVDKDARLLWRFPPRRLTAEEIRDTILSASGKLNLTMGGPGFRLYKFTQDNVCTYLPLDKHGPETYRRAVYHQNARASVVDLLSDFDLPDNSFSVPRRSTTTTPLQALTLLNHSFTLDMAGFLAERIREESGTVNPVIQVEHAYALVFQRKPLSEETEAALKLIESHGLAAFCRALLNANEVVFLK
ncbi:PSD1 and planctomycete cytochrome C domain-containing protein [soil metagenome]